jgi:hypothetical protein
MGYSKEHNKAQRVELMTASDGFKIEKSNWFSLYTGRSEKVLQTRATKNRAVFTLPSKTNHPGLLIFDEWP